MDTSVSTQQSQARIQLRAFRFQLPPGIPRRGGPGAGQSWHDRSGGDLGNVAYLDSSALGMLLMLRDKAKSSGKTVCLANARGVRQVLDIANFGKLFPIV